jgi:hypothetical protein
MRPTGLRSALGLRRVAKACEPARIEEACELALRLGGSSYKSVERMLRLAPQRQERASCSASPYCTGTLQYIAYAIAYGF